MARRVEYVREIAYQRRASLWLPEINAGFRGPNGKWRTGAALLDSGSPWCAVPEEIAAKHFEVNLGTCQQRPIKTAQGTDSLKFTQLTVSALGIEVMCEVLLIKSDVYLIGRDPFFERLNIGFYEEALGSNNRILVSIKQDDGSAGLPPPP